MHLLSSQRIREFVRTLLNIATLCVTQLCLASSVKGSIHHVYLSQSGLDIDSLSPMDVVIIVVIGIVGLLVLAWITRQSIRRRRLSSLRSQRHGVSGDGTTSNDRHFARARPDKTEVVRNIVIGSEGDVDVRFESEGVSSRHAELLVLRPVDSSPLMPLEPIYYLRDMASTRGIEVLRDGNWFRFRADVVLDDEQLKIGEVETTAGEINRLAIETRVVAGAEDTSPH